MQEIIKTVRINKVLLNQLPDDEKQLFQEALKVRNNAQAPYSHYHVGVALLNAQGSIHSGCNVERCTFSQTTHAEQNAIDTMIATSGPSKIEKVAVVGAHKDIIIPLSGITNYPLANIPCGHCLQIIWENSFQDPKVKILSLEAHGIVGCSTIEDLLPFRFGPGNLNIIY